MATRHPHCQCKGQIMGIQEFQPISKDKVQQLESTNPHTATSPCVDLLYQSQYKSKKWSHHMPIYPIVMQRGGSITTIPHHGGCLPIDWTDIVQYTLLTILQLAPLSATKNKFLANTRLLPPSYTDLQWLMAPSCYIHGKAWITLVSQQSTTWQNQLFFNLSIYATQLVSFMWMASSCDTCLYSWAPQYSQHHLPRC